MFITTSQVKKLVILGGILVLSAGFALAQNSDGGPYGFGQPVTKAEISAISMDALPDGRGMPKGIGNYAEGEKVYMESCAACHGENLQGVRVAGGAALIGGRGTLASGRPRKTVESYWPYATTLFNYVRKAMPFDAPGSLTIDEVYAVNAYILARADIITKDQVMNEKTLPEVKMPNRKGFITHDPRPDVHDQD